MNKVASLKNLLRCSQRRSQSALIAAAFDQGSSSYGFSRIHVSRGMVFHHSATSSSSLKSICTFSNCRPFSIQKASGNVFDMFDNPNDKPRRTLMFTSSVSGKPKKQKLSVVDDGVMLSGQCGEDAFFQRVDAMGVADGVGGWANVRGAKPELYARKIMHYCSLELQKFDDLEAPAYSPEEYYNLDPKSILQKSYDQVEEDCRKERILGSSTALISVLRDEQLRIAHLGDCALMVIRGRDIIFRTEEQQHAFNFPYQIGTHSSDLPKDALSFAVPVAEGDIVILGSDGVFDNLFDEEILDTVVRVVGNSNVLRVDPKRITDNLLARAREVAEDNRTAVSPFQTRALEEGMYYRGGKMDDITIMAGIVRLMEDSSDRR